MGAVAAGAAASAAGPCCGPSTEQEHVMINRVLRFPNAGTIALVVASCLAPLSLAHADACRVTPNVAESADPDKNTGMNGHVTAHILGMRPPKGESQSGRTLFADKTKASAAWRQYQYVKDPVGCSGKAASQSVSLKDLGISNLDAYSCTAANANGECTAKTLYVAKSVFFGFILDPTYKWILNTMYPEPLQ
jgi:hypothetical protein